jgi:hypothetical protein
MKDKDVTGWEGSENKPRVGTGCTPISGEYDHHRSHSDPPASHDSQPLACLDTWSQPEPLLVCKKVVVDKSHVVVRFM